MYPSSEKEEGFTYTCFERRNDPASIPQPYTFSVIWPTLVRVVYVLSPKIGLFGCNCCGEEPGQVKINH